MTNDKQAAALTLADPRWQDVISRNKHCDGNFFYSVRSTGVYCRPSCAARMPLPQNVGFHETAAQAEAAGFRPCLRCRPGEPVAAARAALVERVCRFVDGADDMPQLADMAAHVQLSPHHLHRQFRAETGLTPRAYAQAVRDRRLRGQLDAARSVTTALHDAGYASQSAFYAGADNALGMLPRVYKSGGKGATVQFALAACTLGRLLVAGSERGICAISIGDDDARLLRELEERFPKARFSGGDAAFDASVAAVVALVDAPGLGLALPLDVQGTLFQKRVWQALQRIPAGTTVSYSALAREIGAPRSVRAVASACAANVLAVVIPCHRVVRQDGALSGYRWGIERKRRLLEDEAARHPPPLQD